MVTSDEVTASECRRSGGLSGATGPSVHVDSRATHVESGPPPHNPLPRSINAATQASTPAGSTRVGQTADTVAAADGLSATVWGVSMSRPPASSCLDAADLGSRPPRLHERRHPPASSNVG